MNATENSKTMSVLGFKNVKIADVNAFFKEMRANIAPADIQFVDAEKVAGKSHLFFAFINAQKSFEQKRSLSENIGVETLLYAACTRQIGKAIYIIGIKPQTTQIIAIIFAPTENEVVVAENKLLKLMPGVQDDCVLNINNDNKVQNLIATFGITELELKSMMTPDMSPNETLTWLIVERVSLSAIKR